MKYLFSLLILITSIFANAQDTTSFSISGVEAERNQSADFRKFNNESVKEFPEFDENDTLSTPNPSEEAVALYRFLKDMFGKRILSGQMWVQWGLHEVDYIEANTGEKPAIAGFDYINESQNPEENRRIIAYWQNGGIPTVMWHWGAPGVGEGYENSKGKIDIERCFIEGTKEYIDFWDDLERIGNYLEKLQEANVPVIWRPLHELDGNWFWWSKDGPEAFKQVWIAMYNYLVHERKINNLIWTLCYTAEANPAWFPGDQYVDIAGADTYDNLTDPHVDMFNRVLGAVDGNAYPITFHETGNPPNPEECIVDGAMWSWWMIWHTDWLTGVEKDYLKAVYASDLVMNHGDLPDIVGKYGWGDNCQPSTITAAMQVDGGDWYDVNRVGVTEGATLTLRVDTEDEGSWEWSGYGVSNMPDNSATTQIVSVDGLGLVTATFTNTCGAVSTQTFHIVDGLVLTEPLSTKGLSQNEVDVYPSPASELLQIRLPEKPGAGGATIRILDVKGTLILEELSTSAEIALNIAHLSPGVYHLVVMNAGYPTIQRFVVN